MYYIIQLQIGYKSARFVFAAQPNIDNVKSLLYSGKCSCSDGHGQAAITVASQEDVFADVFDFSIIFLLKPSFFQSLCVCGEVALSYSARHGR